MKTLKNYKKLFSDFWGYHENGIPLCWNCHKEVAVDIHHLIPKGMGGVKNNRLNRIDNLYALCRKCHTLGHSDKELNEQWKKDLLERIEWKKENPDGW